MSSKDPTFKLKNIGQMLTSVLDWHTLGGNLGLPESSLGAIRIDHSAYGTDRQRSEMISKWLAYDTKASWSKLATALEEMGNNTLAEKIREKYIPGYTSKQDDESTAAIAVTTAATAATTPVKPAKKPTKRQLMKLLYNKIADKWHALGDFLEIPTETLNIIGEKEGSDPQKCLLALFDVWLSRLNPPPTWEAMADAVDVVANNSELAEQVRKMENS